jgi:ethanolamine utilization protein EutN
MFLARVVGDVVATIKHAELEQRKLLLVQPLTDTGEPRGRPVIAVDSVDAGTGDHVLVVDEGNSAAQVLGRPRGPVRTVVVGVVDHVEHGGEQGTTRG